MSLVYGLIHADLKDYGVMDRLCPTPTENSKRLLSTVGTGDSEDHLLYIFHTAEAQRTCPVFRRRHQRYFPCSFNL